MSYFSNHGGELYYETFGAERPDRVPVLLIHGAFATGHSDWECVVERLERDHFLVVPDRRGHGRSSHPDSTCPFRKHAEDMAALVRGLGFPAVHVVGSGAGGNIALHLLLECPDLVRTCIVGVGYEDAAGFAGWATPEADLERLGREQPALWRRLRESLPSVDSSDDWRTLARLTFAEFEEGAGFTEQQLGSVACPMLIVDSGATDTGAPSPQGAHLAGQIPEAELWPCQGAGQPAHKMALREWCARVTRFWEWRGDAVSERLHRHRRAHFPDGRQGPFEVRAEGNRLVGTVLDGALLEEASSVAGLPATGVQILLTEATPWALVQCPVEDLRREPNRLTERMSQALQGEAVRVLQSGPDWSKVRMERDGYIGWIHTHALHACDADRARSWSAACNARVVARLADAKTEDGRLGWKLPFATKVRVIRTAGPASWIQVPDGSTWELSSEDLEPIGEPRTSGSGDITRVLTLFHRFVGTPYLWGGRTPFGYDCSGLAGTFYDYLGVVLPRDADQQFAKGATFEGPRRPGDLLFFGELQSCISGRPASGYARHARITHVAVSLGGDDFIHSDGHHVTCNSLDRESPLFDAWSFENFRGARRFVPLPPA